MHDWYFGTIGGVDSTRWGFEDPFIQRFPLDKISGNGTSPGDVAQAQLLNEKNRSVMILLRNKILTTQASLVIYLNPNKKMREPGD